MNSLKILIFVQEQNKGMYKSYVANEDVEIKETPGLTREDILQCQLNRAVKIITQKYKQGGGEE